MISSSDILQGKILIVDDKEANILLLDRMLRGAGYVFITSTMDANEVCKLHLKNNYDLILLDLEMPSMAFSGFQVMECLREIEADSYIPVIVITAHSDHMLHAFQAGARDFIRIPFELPEALARIRNLLELRLLYREMKIRLNALKQTTPVGDITLVQPVQPPDTRPYTVLYVEDNPANMKLVEKIIARHPNIKLLTAVSGISGVEIARSSHPDVILMDINLPGINGIDALKILGKDPLTANIPVIAVSANAMALDVEMGMKTGFFNYIAKPIKVDELMGALNMALKFSEQKSGKQNKGLQIP